MLFVREGRSNAHVKGDYQRIGDVMLKNMTALKVSPLIGPHTLMVSPLIGPHGDRPQGEPSDWSTR